VACEFSGIVRDAFIEKGHKAVSCDIRPSERPGPHFQGDVRCIIKLNWDLLIAHPPCTYLAVSGNRWMGDYERLQKRELALDFVRLLMDAKIPRICVENPLSVISTRIRKPDQIVQPWIFGHPEIKMTCLWLKNLPKLKATKVVTRRAATVWLAPDSLGRQDRRSRTFTGIVRAMADQWGSLG
jgi:hypothetical protein